MFVLYGNYSAILKRCTSILPGRPGPADSAPPVLPIAAQPSRAAFPVIQGRYQQTIRSMIIGKVSANHQEYDNREGISKPSGV